MSEMEGGQSQSKSRPELSSMREGQEDVGRVIPRCMVSEAAA